nr:hypothetical protein [Tanacetum cinerariifolium]
MRHASLTSYYRRSSRGEAEDVQREGSDADGHRRLEVVRLIQEVEKVDAMEVAQKAKIKWSIEDDIWMESPHLVKHEFFEHFKNRFEKPNKSRILLERVFVKRISLEQNDDLEREVYNEEIKRAVWDCGIDKAPGPDSFTFGFYRQYWDIIGVTVLDDIVDEIQSAFVTDTQILDGLLILNEIVHWCKNKKKQSMIFKVDFEKAYDSVRWDFIDDILRSQCNIDTIIQVLDVFYRVSGLRINMNKSNLMCISVDSNKVKHAAAKIGCLVLKTPFNYLGSRVGDLMSRIQSWHDVTEGMHTRLFALNRALMFKWVWRFFSQKNSLRVRVVKALHGEDGKIGKKVQSRYPSTWLNIINEIKSLKLHAWCEDVAFKNLVPRLYALESMKNKEVALKLSHRGLEFSFRRNPRGGVEQAQFERKLIDNAILPKGILKTRWIKERNLKIFGQEDPSTVNVYDEVVYRSFY